MSEMTERQLDAWPEAIAEAQRHVGDTIDPDLNHWAWRVRWENETRPGRGHAIRATWCDGENLVDITMDVYGQPSVGVAQVSWIHNDADEECRCGCRDEDDPESHDVPTTVENR